MTYLIALAGNIGLVSLGFQPIPREFYGPMDASEAAMLRAPGSWIQALSSGEGGTILEGDVAVFDCKVVDAAGNVLVDTSRRGIPMTIRVKSEGLWNIVLHQMAREEERFALISKSVLPNLSSDVTVRLKMRQIVRAKAQTNKLAQR